MMDNTFDPTATEWTEDSVLPGDPNAVARWQKVSFEEYVRSLYGDETLDDAALEVLAYEWESIRLPERKTTDAAGYDFFLPRNVEFKPGTTHIVSTGIRASVKPGWYLAIVPRSGLGFKYGMSLRNTVGIVDGDYYYADNEGHIKAAIQTGSNFALKQGDRFMQGIFMPYGLASNGNANVEQRTGGIGSTGV